MRNNVKAITLLFTGVLLLSACTGLNSTKKRQATPVAEKNTGQSTNIGGDGMGGTGLRVESDPDGIGGTGLQVGSDPDGIGGTGIIGPITQTDHLAVAGVSISLPENLSIHYRGSLSSQSVFTAGRYAAIELDARNRIQQVHVFDAAPEVLPFAHRIGRLLIEGRLTKRNDRTIRVNGLSIQTGQTGSFSAKARIVRINATIDVKGRISAQRIEVRPDRPIFKSNPDDASEPRSNSSRSPTTAPTQQQHERPQANRPETPRVLRPQLPEHPERPNINELPTRPEPIDRPDIEIPPRPQAVDRPVSPDLPIRTNPVDRPAPPIRPDPPALDQPSPSVRPDIQPVDRPEPPAADAIPDRPLRIEQRISLPN